MNCFKFSKKRIIKINFLSYFKKRQTKLKLLFLNMLCFFLLEYVKKKNTIPIVFSLNDNYAYQLIVLLTSILYNSSLNTFFIFYLLLAPDLQKIKLKKIFGLNEKYKNFKIVPIYMGAKFSNYNTGYYKTPSVYYRLAMSDLITNVDKIIYLDIDTIVHKDLNNLYNINMKNYYYMGFPGLDLTSNEFNGTRNFINSGVMLINLKKLREVNSIRLFKNYYMKYGTKKVDEYLINAVFYNNIGFLPLIYGIPDFGAGSHHTLNPLIFLKKFKNLINYTKYDIEYGSENRAITHNCYERKKWWERDYYNLTNIGKQWLFYASKTNVFDDICNIFIQFKNVCDIFHNKRFKKNNIFRL